MHAEAELAIEVVAFRRSLDEETDRGCALMSAAYLADQLGRLLVAAFIDDCAASTEALRGGGSLSSFSSRIEHAYLMGLIPAQARRDLRLIRRIRNRFGHTAAPLTFDDPAISSQCREFHHRFALDQDTARAMFISTSLTVCGRIHAALLEVQRPPAPEEAAMGARTRNAAHLASVILPEPPSDPGAMAEWLETTRAVTDAIQGATFIEFGEDA